LTNLKNPEFFNIGMRNSIQTSSTESYRIITGPSAQKQLENRMEDFFIEVIVLVRVLMILVK